MGNEPWPACTAASGIAHSATRAGASWKPTIYFSGGSFSKAERVMSALNVEEISSATFYRHSESFLQPTMLSFWCTHQLELIKQIASRTGEVVMAGDMRADSPGHCAKCGSYTMLEVRSNKIVDVRWSRVMKSVEVVGWKRKDLYAV